MTTSRLTCPEWCHDHRSGETIEDEQHARLFDAPEGTWVAIFAGVLPGETPELAFGAEMYTSDVNDARQFASAIEAAAELFDEISRA